jgi:Asp-tRNA(Asn)/Glu-tRNA(Gln) amidotransferase A subunit family amidase
LVDGLPVGLQIVGRPQGEESVLALAAEVQRANPIHPPQSFTSINGLP